MTPLLVTSCLLAFVSAVHGKPSFIENDSIVFPDSDNDTAPSQLSSKLKECIEDNFKIEFNGECRSLLTTDGVCPDDFWLVLDFPSASLSRPIIKGKCVHRRCAPKQHYWAQRNICVYTNDSSSLCPRGNIISTDMFGEGFCECIREPVHAEDRNGVCYPVYTKGPCPGDRVFVEVNSRGECRADNCTVTRGRFPNKTIVSWVDGKCYAVNERGPCPQGFVVRLNPWNTRPECGDPLTPLHLIAPPCTGFDHSGQCTQSVNSPPKILHNEIAEQIRKKNGRKAGDIPK